MAKEKPEKAEGKVTKEKKSSEDKVKKKERKERKAAKEIQLKEELELRLKKDVEPDLEGTLNVQQNGAIAERPKKRRGSADLKESKVPEDGAVDTDSESEAEKLGKTAERKQQRKQRRKEERIQEMVFSRLMDEEFGSSSTVSGRHMEAAKERKDKKKAERRAGRAAIKAKQEAEALAAVTAAAAAASATQNTNGGLFAIDTKPTPVDLEALAAARLQAEKAAAQKAEVEAPSLNRAARRRLKLIARQREAIIKQLGLADQSAADMEEVEAKLAEWTEQTDIKTSARLEKKKVRKAKEALRLRNRRGKLLKGRQLKERQKVLRKQERKHERTAKKAISGGE